MVPRLAITWVSAGREPGFGKLPLWLKWDILRMRRDLKDGGLGMECVDREERSDR